MKQSPMLKHAIESFEHGLEHYLDGTERSRKFALLHIDHSIELMIKEKCVLLGKSIFKSDGTTLGVHEAFNSLKKENVAIPEQPRLEDLHDLRNTIQHKGLVPDSLTAQFHVEIAYEFVKRFLQTEIGISLHDALPSRYIRLMEGITPVETLPSAQHDEKSHVDFPIESLNVLAEALREAWDAENPTSQIVAGYSVLVQAVRMIAGVSSDDEKVKFKKTLKDAAVNNGISPSKIESKLKSALIIRGMALKPEHESGENEGIGMLRAVESILQMVGLGAAINTA
jgi:hypothetical protein